MIYLDALDVFVPDFKMPVTEMTSQTGLSREMLSIYKKIYGLNDIPIYNGGDLESFLSKPLTGLLSQYDKKSGIQYIIYVHTTGIILPYGNAMLQRLKNQLDLNHVIAFSMTLQKCASFFKALEVLTVLLSRHSDASAIVLTGEVAFSPQLRVVPRSSIVGDAATASIFSLNGKNHALLAIKNIFIPGYAKGIYLSDDELRDFDAQFIQMISENITQTVLKAGILLQNIALILPHNVNIPTWKKIAFALHLPFEIIYTSNIARLGHTFCSDHILNLESALSEGRLKKGDYYLMVGCGMGFYLSVALFRY